MVGLDVKLIFPDLALKLPEIEHGCAAEHRDMIEELAIVVLPVYRVPFMLPVTVTDEILSIASILFT